MEKALKQQKQKEKGIQQVSLSDEETEADPEKLQTAKAKPTSSPKLAAQLPPATPSGVGGDGASDSGDAASTATEQIIYGPGEVLATHRGVETDPKTKKHKSKAMQDKERRDLVKAELAKKYDLITAAAAASATPRGAGVVAAAPARTSATPSGVVEPKTTFGDASAEEILNVAISNDFRP